MICELCGKEFKRVTRSHLEKKHNLSAPIYFRSYDKARFHVIGQLYEQGYSSHEIARQLSLSITTVKRILKRRGITRDTSLRHKLAWAKHRQIYEKKVLAKAHSHEAWRKGAETRRHSNIFSEACRQRQIRFWQDPIMRAKMIWGLTQRKNDPDYRARQLQHLANLRSRKGISLKEQRLKKLLEKYDLPYVYVGDSNMLVGELNPDFIHCQGYKRAIELFERGWHDPLKANCRYLATEPGRKEYFAKHGWELLIIWDDDLEKDVYGIRKKIMEFEGNGNHIGTY